MGLLLLHLQYIAIVVFYESNWVAFQIGSIWNYSPVQCGWVHPVKKHSQQLLVSNLKEKTKKIGL